jgi:hypothetical protein
MHEVEKLLIFAQRLDDAGVDYMITGSVACLMYAEPRFTHDIDLVVHLQESNFSLLPKIFPDTEFYCPPIEVIRLETTRELHGHFNIIHHTSGQKADLYPLKDDLHRWAFARRKQDTYHDKSYWLAPAEYVILRKLQYFRDGTSSKHKQDVINIMTGASDQIDMDVLLSKIHEYQLDGIWKEWSLNL